MPADDSDHRPSDGHERGLRVETAREVAPWLVSVGAHAVLIVVGFLVTWTVVLLKDEPPPPVIVANFESLVFDPVATLGSDEIAPETLDLEAPTEPLPLDRTIDDQFTELQLDPVSLLADAAREPPAEFAAPAAAESVSFIGLSTTNARDIVYVIDASGSMIASLQIVLDELARSLDQLTGQQRFGVIFFQQNDAVMVPPESHLAIARSEEKLQALRWARDNVVPRGRSNPLRAIERALSFEPDVIFLLSENITGSGQFEIDQGDLLKLLEQLNPYDQRTGRRATQINCIQFLDPDPLDTLRRIAELHGGERGYKFLDRQELGIARP